MIGEDEYESPPSSIRNPASASRSVAPNLVSQANPTDQAIVLRRRPRSPPISTVPSDSTIEVMHPSSGSPKNKPNDLILLYRDFSDLLCTGVKSVFSGIRIMVNEKTPLKRRALHNDSLDSVNGGSRVHNTTSTLKMQQRNERKSLTLLWKPHITIFYFLLECKYLLGYYSASLWRNKFKVLLLLSLISLGVIAYHLDGEHQKLIDEVEERLLWWGWWVLLGIMSSVGLGTGLHTFLLYLGPFIADVTMGAYECNSLEFQEPPYPNSIVCPAEEDPTSVSLLSIMSKVRIEAMMWGAGTALGELPPYFMARAARLSGDEVDDEDLEEVLEMKKEPDAEANQQVVTSFSDRVKKRMHDLVHNAGFFGILLCASIPNPLFDLAGITCGHFLVPFWTFFGATLIGKALIKMHLQKLVVIILFSAHHVENIVQYLRVIPYIGDFTEKQFAEFADSQKSKYHKDKRDGATPTATPWLAWIFEKLVLLMVIYFVISIINSLAQSYHKRICKERNRRRDA